jgi:hypothetical protein
MSESLSTDANNVQQKAMAAKPKNFIPFITRRILIPFKKQLG